MSSIIRGPEACSEKQCGERGGRCQVREKPANEGDPISIITCSPPWLPDSCRGWGLAMLRE